MVCSAEVSRANGAKSKGAVTPRGKAIASRNATKHGLLAQQPPILASEDLETFQGLVQSLVDEYEPVGAIEWHLIQTIAMCIQRQYRLWGAEAALGNAQLLPPVAPPTTDKTYSAQKSTEHSDSWSQYHPVNLSKEKQVLQWFVERYPETDYPTERRSKYFADIWKDWVDSNVRDLKRLQDEYPIAGIPGKPDDTLAIVNQERYCDRYQAWMMDLWEQHHPYAESRFHAQVLSNTDPPKTKGRWEFYRERHSRILGIFRQRIEQIERIEDEVKQEQERYQRDLAEYREQTTSPISEQVLRLSRYESHIAKQMQAAIAQFQNLQKERQHGGSMGSFGQKPDRLLYPENKPPNQ